MLFKLIENCNFFKKMSGSCSSALELRRTKQLKDISELQRKVGLAFNVLELAVTKSELDVTINLIASLKQLTLQLNSSVDVALGVTPVNYNLNTGADQSAQQILPGLRKVELLFQGTPFDENGLMYLIGTQGKTIGFSNPHELGAELGVVASMSSVYIYNDLIFGDPRRFVDHTNDAYEDEDGYGTNVTTGDYNMTDNIPNSWMMVDIGYGRSMVVNNYCLRHVGDGCLRNWVLQGSNSGCSDTLEWIDIKSHVDDQTISGRQGDVGHWTVRTVDFSPNGFRFFRILSSGVNDCSGYSLCCSGIELYGTFTTNRQPC